MLDLPLEGAVSGPLWEITLFLSLLRKVNFIFPIPKGDISKKLCNLRMATSTGDIDQWVEIAKECKYLPENDLKVSLSC